jgi:hypothetical protein
MVLASDDSDASDTRTAGGSGKSRSRVKIAPVKLIPVVKVDPVPVVKMTLMVQMVPLLQVRIQLEAVPGLKSQGT